MCHGCYHVLGTLPSGGILAGLLGSIVKEESISLLMVTKFYCFSWMGTTEGQYLPRTVTRALRSDALCFPMA